MARASDPGRAFAVATAAYVLGILAQNSWLFFLAPVSLRAVGAESAAPWTFAASAAATMLAVVPAGKLADRVPRRWVFRGGLGLLALSYVPVALGPDVGLGIAASLVSGTGLALLFVSFQSYVADLLADGDMAGAYGRSGALAILGSAAGPFAGALVFDALGDEVASIRACAALYAACALVALALTMWLPPVRTPSSPPAVARPRGAPRTVVAVGVLYLFLGASFGLAMPYFSVYFLEDLDFTSAGWGLLLALSTVASATGFYLAGRLGRDRPVRPLLLGGQLATLFVSVAFVLPLGALALGAAYVARTLVGNAFAPFMNALMMRDVPAHERGAAQGWVSLTWNLGWTAGALGGGALLARLDGALFALAAALGLVGSLLALASLPRAPRGPTVIAA